MAPARKKKKDIDSKPTSKQVVPNKDRLKNRRNSSSPVESTLKKTSSAKKLSESERDGISAKESTSTHVPRKPCTWLKLDRLDPQNGIKSYAKNSNQSQEAKSSRQIDINKNQKRKRTKNEEEKRSHISKSEEKQVDSRLDEKGKGLDGKMHKDAVEKDEKSKKNVGGLIFMCNAKTKPDCFRYQVMGVPASKKEIVLGIKLGLKIFLYDYDLKLLYGIFETSSAGGMKLEPTAFDGGFPAQVRFVVYKDCIPLPESVFRKAIIDNYDKRTNKFDTQLTVRQVKNLTELFQPTPWANSTRLDHEKQFSEHHRPSRAISSQDPLFLTELEYKNYGLQGKHLLLTTEGGDPRHSFETNNFDQELKQILMDPAATNIHSSLQNREVNQQDPLLFGEKEYRFYGLRSHQQIPNAAPPITGNGIARDYGSNDASINPYDDVTASLVNRYLSLPRTTAIPADPHRLSGREIFVDNPFRSGDIRTHLGMQVPLAERPITTYRLHEHYNSSQGPYSLHALSKPPGFSHQDSPMATAPVSHRYSFAGPSQSQQR